MRRGAMRSNQHDAHELCGPSDAENGSARAIPGGAWSKPGLRRKGLDRAVCLPSAAIWGVPRVWVGIRCFIKATASLGGPLPLPGALRKLEYTRRSERKTKRSEREKKRQALDGGDRTSGGQK